ncbi:MAG: biotin/lipoyl-containing protein, partial [Fimbriimonadaceae bacterium]
MSDQQHDAVTPILLPQAGNTMEEGTILEWRVSPGDRVRPGQVLFELETDKATIEVEAETEGRVAKILVPAGQSVPVKTVVALLAEDDAAAERFAAQAVGQAPGAPQPAQEAPERPAETSEEPRPAPSPTRRKASPAARAAAA